MKIRIEEMENGNLRVAMPIALRFHGGKRRVVPAGDTESSVTLLAQVARAYAWQKAIDDGRFANGKELAKALGIDVSRVSRTPRLARLSPSIVHRIITGDYPQTLNSVRLRETIPLDWDEQEKVFFQP